MEYNFSEIEKKWQSYWRDNKIYKVDIDKNKPKYYVLDMFPYPSGAGLHVGHPLGYIASDIYARYKHLKGYNVLHPMGFDAFGLPAEQYAIQTGQHPAVTTQKNIEKYKSQLNKIGFNYDWDREVVTSDHKYYKWTQWTFIKMFHHWYDKDLEKARPISELISEFEKSGTKNINAAQTEEIEFTAEEWKSFDEKRKQEILMNYRIAYLSESMVNWCPALGTVLANDEVKDGVSIRGGYEVVQRKMKQWSLRVSAYAERLLEGLNRVDWTDSLKEMQRNWIGKSEGAEVFFPVKDSDIKIKIFTTRPDTIFGATFMVLAPELDIVKELTTEDKKEEASKYIDYVLRRTERERLADTKNITGVFIGSYAVNPFTGKEIPIYISDYVLSGYGTGAIMAVPAHDSRDFAFAKHFNLPVIQVVKRKGEEPSDPATWEDSYDSKEGELINSGFLNGLEVKEAFEKIIEEIEKRGLGKRKINYKLRDAIFSRQRYWGEPFPVYYKDGVPYTLPEEELPLELPEIDSYKPTEEGEPPLARAKNWKTKEGYPLETSTMPGFAGSSGYYLRYMDPHNDEQYFSPEAVNYWRSVDLYVGGAEHATGHLIYARFWNKFLFDMGMTPEDEPFKKLINQGMIQGRSNFVYRIKGTNTFVSYGLKDKYDVTPIHVDISLVKNDVLDIEAFKNWRPEFNDAEFILEDGKYICGWAVEKMSKSMYNVVNPDDIIDKYGADTLRLYEMFLGPIEQHKPWDTNGIDGVHKFLKKFWRLFHLNGSFEVSDEKPTGEELKILHRTIKKVTEDIETFNYNTAISTFMICVNDLTSLKCNKKEVLEPLTVLLSPFAPHIAEELWHLLGHEGTVYNTSFPSYDDKYLVENEYEYPVSFNGKMRFKIKLPLDMPKEEVEKAVLGHEKSQKWLDGKKPKKVIIVPKKIINIVV